MPGDKLWVSVPGEFTGNVQNVPMLRPRVPGFEPEVAGRELTFEMGFTVSIESAPIGRSGKIVKDRAEPGSA